MLQAQAFCQQLSLCLYRLGKPSITKYSADVMFWLTSLAHDQMLVVAASLKFRIDRLKNNSLHRSDRNQQTRANRRKAIISAGATRAGESSRQQSADNQW